MKYIDAEKLLAEIARLRKEHTTREYRDEAALVLDDLEDCIDSLQQEQQEKKEVKFVFPKFLYARTTNNKTIDVSYAPQSLDAIEYIRSDSLQQEQPETFDTAAFQKGVEEGRRLERDEPVTDCHDLTEAAENYIAPIENDEGLDYINFNGRDIKDAFKAEAEWQKAKMMEGAVVARVSIDELSCGLYNLCVEAGITSETDTTIIILPKED